jgi:hypothetical protein
MYMYIYIYMRLRPHYTCGHAGDVGEEGEAEDTYSCPRHYLSKIIRMPAIGPEATVDESARVGRF